jgi:hypothetical protein
MIEWSVEAAPNAVATQVADGIFKLPVAIFIDYKLIAACELTLTADQIELMFVRGLIVANGTPRKHRREPAARTSPQGEG